MLIYVTIIEILPKKTVGFKPNKNLFFFTNSSLDSYIFLIINIGLMVFTDETLVGRFQYHLDMCQINFTKIGIIIVLFMVIGNMELLPIAISVFFLDKTR